jgi:hypothetical protein
LFVDELFNLKQIGSGEILPKDIKNYDIKNNQINEKFLPTVFLQPQSILPL